MGQKLLNYTTEVSASKTISEIQDALLRANATAIITEATNGTITGILFRIRTPRGQELPFRLPAKVDEAYRVMYGHQPFYQKERYGQRWREQAQRTAWRIVLTWLRAQLSIIELELAKPEEVFLPYMLNRSGQTYFEALEQRQFLLEAPANTDG
jgi:hypothetical protein